MEQHNREINDETSLYDLWKVITKRKIIIIGTFIVIVAGTAIGSFLMPNIYRGAAMLQLVFKPDIITSQEVVNLLGNIDREKGLSIVPKSYSSIKDIKFVATRESRNQITVTIDGTNIDDMRKVLPEIVHYLNNIDLLKTIVKQQREALAKKSDELTELLKSGSDTLAAYNALFKAGKLTTIGFSPVDINKRMVDMEVELLQTKQLRSSLDNGCIIIAAQPLIPSNPVSPKILRNIIVAGMLGLFFGVFFAFFIEYIGNIKNKKSKPVNHSSLE